MSRRMHGDEAAAYRAVITTTYPAVPDSPIESRRVARKVTKIVGPYGAIGAAKAAITSAKRDAARWSWAREIDESGLQATAEGHVEQSSIEWKRVDS